MNPSKSGLTRRTFLGGAAGAAITAGALAALADKAHLASVLEKVARARETIGAIARANRLVPLASATNFVTIDCGRDGAHAKRVLDGLIAQGVFVRLPGVAPLNRCFRVSAGMEADLAVFAEALPKVLGDRVAKSVGSIVVDSP